MTRHTTTSKLIARSSTSTSTTQNDTPALPPRRPESSRQALLGISSLPSRFNAFLTFAKKGRSHRSKIPLEPHSGLSHHNPIQPTNPRKHLKMVLPPSYPRNLHILRSRYTHSFRPETRNAGERTHTPLASFSSSLGNQNIRSRGTHSRDPRTHRCGGGEVSRCDLCVGCRE